ncbi:glrx3 [Symbiodinium pilosum]|uniref:Glrx3 protein n=1 Tax=Symbiodinium pilosum TaxID=2952 RepID=A0A812VT26_SYMPI|nr:glrx3 [Symbiodinium pilosum]
MSVVAEVFSEAELQALCGSHKGLTTLLLWAPWHAPSVHLTKVLDAIAAEQKTVRFAKANADVCPGLATALGADQVPFAAFMTPRGVRIDVLAGADPPRLVEKVKTLASRPFDAAVADEASEAKDLTSRLKALVNFSPVMLFMKGSKVEPFCKFSKQAIGILEKHSIEYSTFDILQDDEVRQGLKDFSNWKTYPQLYINGELLGGVDILKEMDEDGSLLEAVGVAKEQPLQERLHGLINQAPVMLFMKGTPDEPRCGFSRKVVGLLNENNIKFDSFDILSDEEVRQGLKDYSNWPTYPQVYSSGKLVGGLDILKELADEGSLLEELSQ